MERAILVYTTFPDEASAKAMAMRLVADKKAACVNLIPNMTSIYAYEGALEEGREVVAIVKTREAQLEAVRAAIRDGHPYQTPVILYLQLAGADPDTLAWLLAETGAIAD